MMSPMRARLSKDKIERAKALRKQGLPWRVIALRLGTTIWSVRKALGKQ